MTTWCHFPVHSVLRGQQGSVTVGEMPGEVAGRLCKFSASSICSFFAFLIFLLCGQGTWPRLHFVTGKRKQPKFFSYSIHPASVIQTELGQPTEL